MCREGEAIWGDRGSIIQLLQRKVTLDRSLKINKNAEKTCVISPYFDFSCLVWRNCFWIVLFKNLTALFAKTSIFWRLLAQKPFDSIRYYTLKSLWKHCWLIMICLWIGSSKYTHINLYNIYRTIFHDFNIMQDSFFLAFITNFICIDF